MSITQKGECEMIYILIKVLLYYVMAGIKWTIASNLFALWHYRRNLMVDDIYGTGINQIKNIACDIMLWPLCMHGEMNAMINYFSE